ncbi:MAG: hypothetical protein WCL00_11410, partial [Bacteroidota bacterium]
MTTITIIKSDQSIIGEVVVPISKSLINRLLILHAMSGVKGRIPNLSVSNDTLLMQKCLGLMDWSESNEAVVVNVEDAGTVMRFLAALAARTPG